MAPHLSSKVSCATLSFAAMILSSYGQDSRTWNGGVDTNWTNSANWTSGVPDSNDIVTLGGSGATLSNVYSGFTSQYRLFFASGAGAYILNGPSSVTFFDFAGGAPKIENTSSNTQTINFGTALNGTNSGGFGEINPVSGDLTLGSTTDLAGTTQLRIWGNNGKTVTFTGGISSSGNAGANSLVIKENSNVVFKGNNSYTGETFIDAGVLKIESGTNSSSFVRLGVGAANASIWLTGATGNSFDRNINVRAGTGTKTLMGTNTSGTSQFAGNIYLDDEATITSSTAALEFTGTEFDLKGQTLTVNGAGETRIGAQLINSAGSGKITKSDTGTLVLTGNNTFSGGVTVIQGSLGIGGNTSLGSGTLAIGGTSSNTPTVFASGGARSISNATNLLATSSGGNPTITGSNALTFTGVVTAANALRTLTVNNTALTTISGNVFLSDDNTTSNRGLTVNGSGNLNVTGNVANNNAGNTLGARLTQAGTGTLSLSGSNTYTGVTTISSGVLDLTGPNGTIASSSNVNVNGGTLLLSGGTGSSVNRLGDSAPIAINTPGARGLKLDGSITETMGALTLSTGTQVIDMGAGAGLITFSSLAGVSGQKLQIWNYSGISHVGGGTDQLIISGHTLSGITLADVEFYSNNGTTLLTGFTGAQWSTGANGNELVPVPEPGALAGFVGLLGSVAWRNRRRR